MKFEEVLSRYILEDYSREDKEVVAAWKKEKGVNESSIDLLRFALRNPGKEKYDSTEVLKKRLSYRINEQRSIKYKRLGIGFVVRIAAAIILPLLLATSIIFYYNQSVDADSFISMNAPIGTISKVLLPDGSEVILNSGSSLKYSANLHKKKQRKVELKGEGFFSVMSDKEHPFIVTTSEINIKALGTKFNVKSYSDESDVTVSLVEGAVQLLDNKSIKDSDIGVLKPGEVARFNKENCDVNIETDTRIERQISWKDGVIIFENEPFTQVLHTMERKYNVQFVLIDKELEQLLITAKFSSETLEDFLFKISNVTDTRNEIINHTENSKKKQIHIKKANN
ncbi:MAG: FecR domain-containing protein [Carboxylicivirga sp.]|jgi:ferric-dicitrate binding protein FerR (iron transport regulator)|nr:FecR domain-containing protein [Carboxylicivirga sp.]